MKGFFKAVVVILSVVLAVVVGVDIYIVNRDVMADYRPIETTETTQSAIEYSDPVERQAREILADMNVYEKIGQMLLYYIPREQPLEKMERWQFGGYIFFERNFQDSNPVLTRQEIASYQSASTIPAFMAVDEEGGGVNRISQFRQYRYAPFPSDIRSYQYGGWDAVISSNREKTDFLSDLGMNMVLAPVADVPYYRSDYIYPRSFSTDCESVSEYISTVVTTMNEKHFLSCVKHFPGYGNNKNTHTGMSLDERPWSSFEERDLKPFYAAVQADVPLIMVSHNVIEDFDPGVPASLSRRLHSYIRYEMSYDGIILCDGLGMQGVRDYVGGDKGEAAVRAVIAGNDMLCATDVGVQLRAIAAAIDEGRIGMTQVDNSVTRVLMTKIKYGLIERKYY